MCEGHPRQSQGCGQLGASLMAWSLVPRELTWLQSLVQVCGPQVTFPLTKWGPGSGWSGPGRSGMVEVEAPCGLALCRCELSSPWGLPSVAAAFALLGCGWLPGLAVFLIPGRLVRQGTRVGAGAQKPKGLGGAWPSAAWRSPQRTVTTKADGDVEVVQGWEASAESASRVPLPSTPSSPVALQRAPRRLWPWWCARLSALAPAFRLQGLSPPGPWAGQGVRAGAP